MRQALSDAAPLYRHAPEAEDVRESTNQSVLKFMEEVLPETSSETRLLAGDLITVTLGTVGKYLSSTSRTPDELKTYGDAMADMFCSYLEALGK